MSSTPPPAPAQRTKFEILLKWVASTTAILSLTVGLYSATKLLSDIRERQRQAQELYQVGNIELDSADYPAAWASFEDGLKSADAGGEIDKITGQLDGARRQLREAMETLAMTWLRNMVVSNDGKFSDIVDKLTPVLTRGAARAEGPRKADLLAHIGWAYFLKIRDGFSNFDPARQYQSALAIDPTNPYANVYWGHWLLWSQEEKLGEAAKHFTDALTSGRDKSYVREIQIAALSNSQSEPVNLELLRTVNQMHHNNETITANVINKVYRIYTDALNENGFQQLTAAMPAGEHVALVRALFYQAKFDSSLIPGREAVLASFQEIAGTPDQALKTWQALQTQLPEDSVYVTVVKRMQEGLKRLSPAVEKKPDAANTG